MKSAVPDGSAVDGFMAVGTEAPYDYYAWVSSAGGNNPAPPPDGRYLLLSDGTPLLLANEEPILLADNGERVASNGEWVNQGKIGGIDEAPTDGKAYGRKNGNWAEVSDKKYVDDSISSARSVGYMMQLTEIDTSGLDENTWYPVTIAAGERMNIRVEVLVSLDSGTKPSWSTHERGFSTRKIWEFAPNAWGVNLDSETTIYLSDFIHADIDPVRGLGNLSHFDTCYVFVRGGGKYHFYASHEAKVILHTDTYAPGDQSVSPTTETPAEIVANIATKEYVDDAAKPYIINSNGTILNKWINNTVITGAGVQGLANELFGSFKGFTEDYCSGKYTSLRFSTRHYDEEAGNYFGYIINTNIQYCLSEPGNGYFELLFTFGYGSTLKSCYIYYYDVSETSNENKIVITDVVRSDNLTTVTKKTAAEYEALGSKDANTVYCVTD